MTDSVNHPAHYKSAAGIESIDVVEAFDLPFDLGNTIKYILRAGRKDSSKTLEDLRKADWYLQRRIWRLAVPDRSVSFDEWWKAQLAQLPTPITTHPQNGYRRPATSSPENDRLPGVPLPG